MKLVSLDKITVINKDTHNVAEQVLKELEGQIHVT